MAASSVNFSSAVATTDHVAVFIATTVMTLGTWSSVRRIDVTSERLVAESDATR